MTDFISLGSTVTADGDCSLEIKRCLLLGRKAMTNIDSRGFFVVVVVLITNLKSKDITLPTEVHRVKTMVFPIVTY